MFGKRTHFYMLAGEVFFKEADLVNLDVWVMDEDTKCQLSKSTFQLTVHCQLY